MSQLTASLLVSTHTAAGGVINYRFASPFAEPLFLQRINLNRAFGITAVGGTVTPGVDATHGGITEAQAPPSTFDTLLNDAMDPAAKLMLDLDYMSDTLKIVGIRTRRLLAAQLVVSHPVGTMSDNSSLAERQP
jgi:hypothetical protein